MHDQGSPAPRLVGGIVLVAAAGLWKLKMGSKGAIVARLGRLPDLTTPDAVTIPCLAAGLALMASTPGLSRRRRAGGMALIVGALLWISSKLPFHDPVFRISHRHGVHLLDAAAVLPIAGAWWLLRIWPFSGRLRSELSAELPG